MEQHFTTTMSESEVNFLRKNLKKSKNYLEFGSGYSTLLAAKLGVKNITTVETDSQYLNQISSMLDRSRSNINLIHADIGPTGEWGNPLNFEHKEKWINYAISIKQVLDPDLILIDGRFRVATFATMCLLFSDTRILFDDFIDRTHYHEIVSTFTIQKTFGRIAIFQIPKKISSQKKMELVRLRERYIFDFR